MHRHIYTSILQVYLAEHSNLDLNKITSINSLERLKSQKYYGILLCSK